MHSNRVVTAGYSIIEVIVVLVVLSVLLAASWSVGTGYPAYLQSSRDSERTSDVEALAREFERFYRVNAYASGPSYPSTTQITSSLSTVLDGATTDMTFAPGQSSVSITAAASATIPLSPTKDQYFYQPLTSADALCTTAGNCVRFNLYYRLEKTDAVVTVESMRQQ